MSKNALIFRATVVPTLGLPGYVPEYDRRGTRIPTRVRPKRYPDTYPSTNKEVPGYLPEYDQRGTRIPTRVRPKRYPDTYPSTTEEVPGYLPEYDQRGTRIPNRVRPRQPRFVAGYPRVYPYLSTHPFALFFSVLSQRRGRVEKFTRYILPGIREGSK